MNSLVWKFLIIAGAMGISLPGEAIAKDSASARITMTGIAKSVCRLPSPSASNMNNASFDGTKIFIAELLDEETATVKASEVAITFPGVLCNYNAYLTLTSTNRGMIRTAGTDAALTGSGTFLDRLHYQIAVTWGSVKMNNFDTELLGADGKIVAQAGGANASDLYMKISMPKGNTPVLAGTYTDNVDINLGYTY